MWLVSRECLCVVIAMFVRVVTESRVLVRPSELIQNVVGEGGERTSKHMIDALESGQQSRMV